MDGNSRCARCGVKMHIWDETCRACGEPDPISKVTEIDRKEAVKQIDKMLANQREQHTVRTTNEDGEVTIHRPTLRALGVRYALVLLAFAIFVGMFAYFDLSSGHGPFDFLSNLLASFPSFIQGILFSPQGDRRVEGWFLMAGFVAIAWFLGSYTYKVLRFRRIEKTLLARRRKIIAMRESHRVSSTGSNRRSQRRTAPSDNASD